jgi:molybdopterin-binding protein
MAEETKDTNEVKKENKKPKKKRSLFHRIVNWFLYFFLGIIVLVLVIVGITQTYTFREFLREKVIEIANGELNGTLYIEKIEGTIFTSLLLRNTVVNMGKDTLLNAGIIEVKTSPLQLLFKKIKVREVLIKNTNIALIEDSTGTLNIETLLGPSEPDTTAAGEFPFNIEVASFKLVNVDFSMQRYDYVNSTAFYDSLYMNDLRVDNIDLDLYAFADINDNEYELELHHFSVSPNVNNLDLQDLTGAFYVSPDEININGLRLVTANSDAELSVKVNNFNLFDSTAFDRIGEAKLDLSLDADKLSFADIAPFMPSMKDVKEPVEAKIQISGILNDLDVEDIKINFLNTQLALTGKVKDLVNADKMYISAAFYDSYIEPTDLPELMPALEIPGAKDLGVLRLDTLTYEGAPLNFKTSLLLNTDKGSISLHGALNMQSPVMVYKASLQTNELDISPFAGLASNINLKGNIEGRGTSPDKLTAKVHLIADGSTLADYRLDTLRFNADADDGLINYELLASSDTLGVDFGGNINFADADNPSYELNGLIRNLDASRFVKDSTFNSDINLSINASGENFDPELMNLYLTLTVFNSELQGVAIDSTRAIVDLRRDDGGQRVINLISDLADITLMGNFSMPKTIELVSGEADVVTSVLNSKLNQIMPGMMEETNISAAVVANPKKINKKNYVIIPDTLTTITYLVDLKDLHLISLFMGDNRIDVDGELSGEINNRGDSMQVTLNTVIDYIKFWNNEQVFFVSNLNLDVEVANKLDAASLNDVYANVSLSTDRIFAGTDIRGLGLEMELNKQVVHLDFSAQVEDYANARITGGIDLSGSEADLSLDTLRVKYNNYTVQNDLAINVAYSQAGINIKDFALVRNNGRIMIEGTLGESGNQNINISVKNFSGKDLAENLMKSGQDNTFDASINLDAKISGNFSEPLFDVHFEVDSVRYQNRNFGNLIADLDYKDLNMTADVKFIDSVLNGKNPALQIKGNIPVNMAFTGVEERFPENADMNINLKSNDFNLAALGDLLPVLKRLRGDLTADINITGTPDAPVPSGYLRLTKAGFLVEMNNLEYDAGLKVTVAKDHISLDSLVISNVRGTDDGGTLAATGKANLEDLSITSSQFDVNGSLKVLDDISKTSSPSVYGNLVIATRGNVEFTATKEQIRLNAPITIREANLTLPPTKTAYQNSNTSFIYKYVQDTAFFAKDSVADFESLLEMSKKRSAEQTAAAESEVPFDFNIDLEIEDEITVVYVLSREINQDLTAVLSGHVIYESVGGKSNAQGELNLLDGSTLEFIKTLDADGTIRFENELTDPYLDITATYLDYFSEAGANGGGDEVPVAVKIKVKGLLSELDKNFGQDENSIAVYYGQENINNNTPSSEYEKADAFWFILTGNFVENTSASSSTPFAAAQATALAGSVLGGFLNQQFGDAVKSLEVRQSNSGTKFNLSGKVNKFRYTIGASDNTFKEIGQATVKIEYPLLDKLLIRLERKESINDESNVTNEMINELGLRYRFEF